ncbi:hypothetical protein [Nocardia camponoti]|uniref:hypothetical protein n=1 Tax=Nocardia camponoti TaxID=1616106 RepID=UPI00166CDCC9|nr:hypothetical protein [Nocardia camponoti]
MAAPAAAAVLLTATGVAYAAPAPSEQPGVTGPADQPGVTGPQTTPPQPVQPEPVAPVQPPRPAEQSPLGGLVPEPRSYNPEQYRAPQPAPQTRPAPPVAPQTTPQYPRSGGGQSAPSAPVAPATPAPSLGEELQGLHAPTPLAPEEVPKVFVSPAATKLGLGEFSIDSPLPQDVNWKVNGHLASAQHESDVFLRSMGVSPERSERMTMFAVLGGASAGAAGFAVGCIPVGLVGGAVGAVGGGLAGAAIGAATVPGAGALPGAAIGAGVGAAGGAAAGCLAGGAAVGIPAAAAGAVVGAAIGSGTGDQDLGPAPQPPTVHDQVEATIDNTVTTAEQATEWVEAQPGGNEVVEAAADFGEQAVATWQATEGHEQIDATVTQAASDFVDAAATNPATAEVTEAVIDVVSEQKPFEHNEFGALTDAVNNGLAVVQGVIR